MPVDAEPLHHRRGDRLTHAVGLGQLLLGCRADGLHRPEPGREGPRRRGADMSDRQGDEDPPQRPVLRGGEVGQQLASVLGEHDLLGLGPLLDLLPRRLLNTGVEVRAEEVGLGEIEEPGLVLEHPTGEEVGRALVSECLDVQRVAGGEVEQPLAQLGGARPLVGASPVGVALTGGGQDGVAFGAALGEDELSLRPVAALDHGAEDLGDHVAGLADHHRVADEHTLADHLGLVVERRERDRRPGDEDRLHVGERGHAPGPADGDPDVEELGHDLLGRVLVGDRPPRGPGGLAEATLDGAVVDLHDESVDLVLGVAAVLTPVPHPLDHLLDPGRGRGVR